jgi:hypothetical protein
MNIKAASMAINTVIGFALLFILMVILLYLLFGKSTLFMKSNECSARGGQCAAFCEEAQASFEGCKTGEVCCIKLT